MTLRRRAGETFIFDKSTNINFWQEFCLLSFVFGKTKTLIFFGKSFFFGVLSLARVKWILGGSGPTLAGSWWQTGAGLRNLSTPTRKTALLGVSALLLPFGKHIFESFGMILYFQAWLVVL